MLPARRLLPLVALTTAVLFQTHWLDDLASGEADTVGRIVSGLGALVLAVGVLLRARRAGRILLAFGFFFTAMVSAADLAGLGVDGTFAPDVVEHWREGLGWAMTALVFATFLLSLAGAALLNRTAQTSGGRHRVEGTRGHRPR